MATKKEKITFYGTGRRKKSIARVRLLNGNGKITVNGKDLDEYFGVETLKVKNMIRNHKLAQAISDVSWSQFISLLEYKAKWNDKKLVKINTYFPSSQTCSKCGYINKEVKDLSVREWTCPNCGMLHDRDINAAKNILAEGLNIA